MSLFATVSVGPHPLLLLPFAAMLLATAVTPFFHKEWWDRHLPKIATGLASVVAGYYILALKNPEPMLDALHEYFSFIALIGSLFVVAGGIHVRVKGEATPAINCAFLFIGAILANVIGTTGASMLLIRPWIRMNKYRITTYHVVFFIFIVSNVGGSLTPIGDPPLFLGYLKGVPFWWLIQSCWQAWLIGVLGLIGTFFVFDHRNFLRAPAAIRLAETAHETWQITGLHNVGFLALILGATLFLRVPAGLGEVVMLAAAGGSYLATPRSIHEANDFNFHPIREVAWLFVGIFATMVPALEYLGLHAKELGLSSEMQFFWLTGLLSSCLDNAPTYLTFLAMAMGLHDLDLDQPNHIDRLLSEHAGEVIAISLGAVFFGATTYIGNGPNFMVKAIAEHAKVKAPSFFAYVLKYSIPILLPLFGIIAICFFSRWRIF